MTYHSTVEQICHNITRKKENNPGKKLGVIKKARIHCSFAAMNLIVSNIAFL